MGSSVIPTETGLPLHLHHATPLVVSGKASLNVDLKSITEGRVGLTMKPVVNYKQSVTAHVICPFTGKFLGSGVDTALHVTLPLNAEIAMQNGHYTVTMRTPEDRESQRTRPLVALRVRPYTTIYDMASSTPPANAANTKVIRMASPLKRKEVTIGRQGQVHQGGRRMARQAEVQPSDGPEGEPVPEEADPPVRGEQGYPPAVDHHQ